MRPSDLTDSPLIRNLISYRLIVRYIHETLNQHPTKFKDVAHAAKWVFLYAERSKDTPSLIDTRLFPRSHEELAREYLREERSQSAGPIYALNFALLFGRDKQSTPVLLRNEEENIIEESDE